MKKLRTKASLTDFLYDELSWRKKELSSLYIQIQSVSEKRLPLVIRCSIVMLYAHWEGFIKNAAEAYLNFIQCQNLKLSELNISLLTLCLRRKLNDFSASKKIEIHLNLINFIQNNLNEKAIISEVDSIKTNSNLSSEVLSQMLTTIGIRTQPYVLKSNLIDGQLLKHRNGVAHGNYLVLDRHEYDALHKEIINMMDQIHADIANAALLDSYRKQS